MSTVLKAPKHARKSANLSLFCTMEMNQVLFGDCRQRLQDMADAAVKVQLCVTSPPYFGLRKYTDSAQEIGQEQTPEAYIAAMVEVFRAVRKVLADDGVLFLNIGDSYAGSWGNYSGHNRGKGNSQRKINVGSATISGGYVGLEKWRPPTSLKMQGIREKELIGIPWLLAFALRADGWMIRQEIIWNKNNPRPESVNDRCTKSHEHIFMLTKSPNYYFDSKAIQEPTVGADGEPGLRNKRTVWNVNTKSYRGAHFATFPAELIVPCILAGSRPGDTVLDPFMGSGTTAAVAIETGRQYLGCELNPDYKALQDARIAEALPGCRQPISEKQIDMFPEVA